MTKKGASYGGGGVPSSIGLLIKDTMTAILQVKNENGAVLCSDTWNYGNNNHYIRKIFYNKENKVMIAQAGDNGVYLENNSLRLVSDILQDFCDNFNSNKSVECIDRLNHTLCNFIDKIILNDNYREA